MFNTCQIWEKASSGQLMSQGLWNQLTPKFKTFFKDGEHSKFSASIPENLGQRCIWKLQLWNFLMAKEPNGEFIGNIRNFRHFLTVWPKKHFSRKWKRDYLNDTSKNGHVEEYRNVLNSKGFNPKTVLFSAPTKKFNRHGKVVNRFKKFHFGVSLTKIKSNLVWNISGYRKRSGNFARSNFEAWNGQKIQSGLKHSLVWCLKS